MTKQFSNYSDLLTFTRASKGHALRPVSYGDELVTNGTFDSDTSGWTSSSAFTATLNQSAGELSVTSTGNYGRALQAITCEIGKIYSLTCDVTEVGTTALVVVAIASSGTVNNAVFLKNDITSTQTVTAIFVATQQTHYVSVGNQDVNTGVTSKFDNISVKEVLFDQPDGTLTLFEHPAGIPRVEYDADGNRLGLLVEEARTNLILNSEDANSWVKSSVSVLQNTTTAPNKTLTADTVTRIASVADIRKTIAVTASNDYTITIFAKADTDAQIQLDVSNGAFSGQDYAQFNINTGAFVSGGTGATYSVVDVGDGWRRYSLTATCTNTQNTGVILRLANDEPVYLWGFQFEQGSFPTSYIKSNSGSTTTRSADVASIPVADFGFNSAVGSVVAEYNPFRVSSTARGVFELSSGTGDDKLHSRASVDKHWLVRSGGVTQASIDLGSATEGQQNKISGAYKLNDFAASLNGSAVTTDTSGSVPYSIEELIIGSFFDGSNLNGHIKSIKYYPRRLTNAQLQDLTS